MYINATHYLDAIDAMRPRVSFCERAVPRILAVARITRTLFLAVY